jgi:hypothetical protein
MQPNTWGSPAKVCLRPLPPLDADFGLGTPQRVLKGRTSLGQFVSQPTSSPPPRTESFSLPRDYRSARRRSDRDAARALARLAFCFPLQLPDEDA